MVTSRMLAQTTVVMVTGMCLVSPVMGEAPLLPGKAQTLLSYEFQSSEGPLRIKDLKGEVVVVAFWASWCKPCKREMPLLDQLHTELDQSRGRVLAVSVDRDPARAKRFVEASGLDLPIFVDGPDGVAREIDLDYLPYTIVFDRSGKSVFAGVTTNKESWKEFRDLVAGIETESPALAVQEEEE